MKYMCICTYKTVLPCTTCNTHMNKQKCVSIFQQYMATWWRHQMETFSALLVICAGNSLVPGEFPAQRPVTRSFDVFFDLRLNKRLSKQSWGWWFETLSCPLWRHCNVPAGKSLGPGTTLTSKITGLLLIPPLMSNYIHHTVRSEITYQVQNFKGFTVEVTQCISYFVTHFPGYVITYPWDQSQPIISKKSSWWYIHIYIYMCVRPWTAVFIVSSNVLSPGQR